MTIEVAVDPQFKQVEAGSKLYQTGFGAEYENMSTQGMRLHLKVPCSPHYCILSGGIVLLIGRRNAMGSAEEHAQTLFPMHHLGLACFY